MAVLFWMKVKNLINCNPEDETPVKDVTIRKIPRYLSFWVNLFLIILNFFSQFFLCKFVF